MNWKPADDLCVRLSDETYESRSNQDFDNLIEGIREVANRYGFDIEGYGNNKSMLLTLEGERAMHEKYKHLYELKEEATSDTK